MVTLARLQRYRLLHSATHACASPWLSVLSCCRDCDKLYHDAKDAGFTLNELRKGIDSGHIDLDKPLEKADVKRGLEGMLLGKPATPKRASGRAERAQHRESLPGSG
jgi:hypothetical protein